MGCSTLSLHFVHARLTLLLLRAIDLQINAVEKLHGNSLWTRTLEALEGRKDANTVLKVFWNISSLRDVFQVKFLDHRQGCLCTLITSQRSIPSCQCQLINHNHNINHNDDDTAC